METVGGQRAPMKPKRPKYLRAVLNALKEMAKGLRLSGSHLVTGYQREAPKGIADPDYFKKEKGPITIQYPMHKVPVPDIGRYRLYMETDDCIGCDKCARICPVDCITIETFRADGDLGRTTDGTMKRLHLPVFDIDMGKCMYCGLCTTVCPTECLTMSPIYDYSEFDRDNFVYHFGAYSPVDESRIRSETEAALTAKKAAKLDAPAAESSAPTPMKRRAIVQPQVEPISELPVIEESPKPRPRPAMRPIMKKAEDEPEIAAVSLDSPEIISEVEHPIVEKVPPRPRPVIQPKPEGEGESNLPKVEDLPSKENAIAEPPPNVKPEFPESKPRPRPRPVMRPPQDTEGGANK